ncbi:hypothetical protein J6590_056694 [Homalodisca vitripennis]|nr:hypothetical protein J6590_056694 [Homalodisca vitripennis]
MGAIAVTYTVQSATSSTHSSKSCQGQPVGRLFVYRCCWSDSGALLHLLKSSLGSGILAMPNAFKNGGLGFGIVGTVIVGIICTHCVQMLRNAAINAAFPWRLTLLSRRIRSAASARSAAHVLDGNIFIQPEHLLGYLLPQILTHSGTRYYGSLSTCTLKLL